MKSEQTKLADIEAHEPRKLSCTQRQINSEERQKMSAEKREPKFTLQKCEPAAATEKFVKFNDKQPGKLLAFKLYSAAI